MKYETEVILSATPLVGMQQLFAAEAKDALLAKGFSFIHIDDDGQICALNEQNQCMQGYRVYLKRKPVFM